MPETRSQNFLEMDPQMGTDVPAGPLWELCPAALALVDPVGHVAVNEATRAVLEPLVGPGRGPCERWIRAAAARLAALESPREVVNSPHHDQGKLEVKARWIAEAGWLLSFLPVAAAAGSEGAELAETVSTLSHELRTPLTSMKSSLNLVLRGETGPLNHDQEHFLGMTLRNIDRLERLVSDLLDVSRADAGHLQLRLEPVDLTVLVAAGVEQHGTAAVADGVRLHMRPTAESVVGLLDADKVEQMLANLLGNALKFTPAGGAVEVRLDLMAGGRKVRLTVKDTGPGMDAETARQALEPFRRSAAADSARVPGTGLGLHITRKLAEVHGGRLGLDTAEGEGTQVWVELPLQGSQDFGK